MKDFKITITNVDMQDPAKLACVEAIVGSVTTDDFDPILRGLSLGECFCLENKWGVYLCSEITLLYSQIKLDPRKLIGEDVDVIIFCKEPSELIEGEFIKCGYEEKLNHLHFCRGKDVIGIDLSKDWLKQNFKCEEV